MINGKLVARKEAAQAIEDIIETYMDSRHYYDKPADKKAFDETIAELRVIMAEVKGKK